MLSLQNYLGKLVGTFVPNELYYMNFQLSTKNKKNKKVEVKKSNNSQVEMMSIINFATSINELVSFCLCSVSKCAVHSVRQSFARYFLRRAAFPLPRHV